MGFSVVAVLYKTYITVNLILQFTPTVRSAFLSSVSFYKVISWNMPLFKVWSEDKLNKKFVMAENFAKLVSRGSDSVYIRLFHECMA